MQVTKVSIPVLIFSQFAYVGKNPSKTELLAFRALIAYEEHNEMMQFQVELQKENN